MWPGLLRHSEPWRDSFTRPCLGTTCWCNHCQHCWGSGRGPLLWVATCCVSLQPLQTGLCVSSLPWACCCSPPHFCGSPGWASQLQLPLPLWPPPPAPGVSLLPCLPMASVNGGLPFWLQGGGGEGLCWQVHDIVFFPIKEYKLQHTVSLTYAYHGSVHISHIPPAIRSLLPFAVGWW